MKLTLLGTGGYHPNDRRHTACLMLPEIGLIFDAGSSFFRVTPRLQTSEVSIVLSHSHLDHICGLTYFLPALLLKKVTSAKVYGDKKTLDAVRAHLFDELIFPILPDFEFIEIPNELNVGDGGRLTNLALPHPGGSRGYRVDWADRSMAYITDTHCDGSIVDFVRGVDLLVHECNFPDGWEEFAKKTGHSSTSPVAQLAKAAGVGQLCLTHVDPMFSGDDPLVLAAAQAIFPNTLLAEDLTELEF